MNARVLIAAPMLLILALLVSCGGSDSSPSNGTSPTLGPACSLEDLRAALAYLAVPSSTTYYLLGVSNTSAHDCSIAGPPTLQLLDSSGNILDIDIAAGTDCLPESSDFSYCIRQGPVELNAGGLVPVLGSVPGQLTVTLAVTSIEFVAPCASPTLHATSVSLSFPGTEADLKADLPVTIDLQTCAPQASLSGFGPVTTEVGSPTPSPVPPAVCALDQLTAGFVSETTITGTAFYTFGITNTSASNCTLPGPPAVHLEDSARNDLGLLIPNGPTCNGTNGPDCIYAGGIEAQSGLQTPGASPAVPGQIAVVVVIAEIAGLDPPCPSSSLAHTVALAFPNIADALRMTLPADVAVQTCTAQVSLDQFN